MNNDTPANRKTKELKKRLVNHISDILRKRIRRRSRRRGLSPRVRRAFQKVDRHSFLLGEIPLS